MSIETEHCPSRLLNIMARAANGVWYGAIGFVICGFLLVLWLEPPAMTGLPHDVRFSIKPGEYFANDKFTQNGEPIEWTLFKGEGRVYVPTQSLKTSETIYVHLALAVAAAIWLVIIWRVRAVLVNAAWGRFFTIDNAVHCYWLGWLLLAVPVLGALQNLAFRWLYDFDTSIRIPLLPTAWIPGLLALVLAEVFLAGAKLEADRQLTV